MELSKEDEDLYKFNISLSRKKYWTVTKRPYRKLLVHRIIAERMIGRPLTTKEQVHHINHNANNNQRTNLLVCSAKQHLAIHRADEMIKLGFDPLIYRSCYLCKTYHLKDEFSGEASACRTSINNKRRGKPRTKRL